MEAYEAALFDARLDGLDVKDLELEGKSAPDAFLEAARRLGVEPSRAVVVEDAIAASKRCGPVTLCWSSASTASPMRRPPARPARTSW